MSGIILIIFYLKIGSNIQVIEFEQINNFKIYAAEKEGICERVLEISFENMIFPRSSTIMFLKTLSET